MVSIGDIVVDMDGRTVKYHSTEGPMTPLEFDLLAALVRHPGQALSRQELLDMVWGYTDVSDSLVNVHVQRLRAKFDELGADRLFRRSVAFGCKIPTELVGSSGPANRNLFIGEGITLILLRSRAMSTAL